MSDEMSEKDDIINRQWQIIDDLKAEQQKAVARSNALVKSTNANTEMLKAYGDLFENLYGGLLTLVVRYPDDEDVRVMYDALVLFMKRVKAIDDDAKGPVQ
jgi:hypothetical protein